MILLMIILVLWYNIGMKIVTYNGTNIDEIVKEAVKVISEGGLIVYPTETCYGVGVDATNPNAVEKLFKYKARREGKPISIAVSDIDMANKYVDINDIARSIYENYLPGPITVVSKGLNKVANGVQSEYGTLGVRMPDFSLILDLVRTYGKPITATSANMSYRPRPYSIKQLLKDLPDKQETLIDLIIDAGELPYSEPSTVVDTTMNSLNIMREGKNLLGKIIGGKEPLLFSKTTSPQETIDFGSMNMLRFNDVPLERPLVFLLSGDLGAGKTQFSKGIARHLGIKDIIKSPTYNIVSEYKYVQGEREGLFVHTDTWRVESEKDILALDYQRYIVTGNIIAIEWADKYLKDLIDMMQGNNARIVNVIFKYLTETEREIATYDYIGD